MLGGDELPLVVSAHVETLSPQVVFNWTITLFGGSQNEGLRFIVMMSVCWGQYKFKGRGCNGENALFNLQSTEFYAEVRIDRGSSMTM